MNEFFSLLVDFATFKILISPVLFVYVYLLGAVAYPFILVYLYRKKNHLPEVPHIETPGLNPNLFTQIKSLRHQLGRHKKRSLALSFILGELLWRLFFEVIMAYFMMAKDLNQLVSQL